MNKYESPIYLALRNYTRTCNQVFQTPLLPPVFEDKEKEWV